MTHRMTAYLEPAHSSPQLPLNMAFMATPVALMSHGCMGMCQWQCQLYQWAFQRALAVVEPSWIERDVLAVWN